MIHKIYILVLVLLASSGTVMAQKPFVEGTIEYKIELTSSDHKTYSGTYIFNFKEGAIRKEIKLNNGFKDILLINSTLNTAFSLQDKNDRKYAVQLKMDEIVARQKKYKGFTLKEDRTSGKIIAGITVFKGSAQYADGTKVEVYFTPEWCPDKAIAFDLFPDARFLPLLYVYTDENGNTLRMEATKVSVSPQENSIFRVPTDYKILTNAEYKKLSK